MALPKLNDNQDIKRVIHHELGHWLMAREVGFEIGEIRLDTLWGKAAGSSKVFPRATSQLSSAESIDEYITKRVMVLCAGVRTEVEWYHRMPGFSFGKDDVNNVYENGVIDTSGLTDKGRIDELLIILAGIRYNAANSYSDLSHQMRAIFETIYSQVCEIAEDFMEKLFILAELIEKEQWQGRCKLTVSSKRLIELEAVAAEKIANIHSTE